MLSINQCEPPLCCRAFDGWGGGPLYIVISRTLGGGQSTGTPLLSFRPSPELSFTTVPTLAGSASPAPRSASYSRIQKSKQNKRLKRRRRSRDGGGARRNRNRPDAGTGIESGLPRPEEGWWRRSRSVSAAGRKSPVRPQQEGRGVGLCRPVQGHGPCPPRHLEPRAVPGPPMPTEPLCYTRGRPLCF